MLSPASDGTPASSEPSAEEIDPLFGTILGGLYRIEGRVGEGGMGTVYRATHVHLGRPFAIKILSRKILGDPDATERLKNEAIAASRIDHDNIVDVVSLDTTPDGDVFIVMELLEGESLAERLERGPLALEDAVRIALAISRALSAAHELGIVHRDLKPENVFLARKKGAEVVKVLDFGISKIKSAEAEAVRLTRTGQLVGTPLYMSPEQARGDEVDARADIYSLGVILYEMLTGSPVFDGRNYFQLLWKHGNQAPEPPSRRRPDLAISPALEAVVLRSLEKSPGDRPPTMAAFEEALLEACPALAVDAIGRSSGSMALPPAPLPPRTPFRRPAVVAGGFAAVVAAVGLFVLGTRGSRDEPAPAPRPSLPDATSSTAGALEAAVANDPADAPTSVSAKSEDVPEPEPARVRVSFVSSPPGADVFAGEERLGTTPFEADLPSSNQPLSLRFSLPGYLDRMVSVIPAEGLRVVGRLSSRRATRERKTLPIKTEL